MLQLSRCPPNARASKTTYLRRRRRTHLPIALRPRLIVTYILNLFMFQCMYHRERLDRARAFSPRDDEWLQGRRCRPLAPSSLGDGEATSLFIISSAGRCRITASEYSARVVHTTSASAIIQHLSALASRWGCHMAPTSSVDPLTLLLVARMRSARGRQITVLTAFVWWSARIV